MVQVSLSSQNPKKIIYVHGVSSSVDVDATTGWMEHRQKVFEGNRSTPWLVATWIIEENSQRFLGFIFSLFQVVFDESITTTKIVGGQRRLNGLSKSSSLSTMVEKCHDLWLGFVESFDPQRNLNMELAFLQTSCCNYQIAPMESKTLNNGKLLKCFGFHFWLNFHILPKKFEYFQKKIMLNFFKKK